MLGTWNSNPLQAGRDHDSWSEGWRVCGSLEEGRVDGIGPVGV